MTYGNNTMPTFPPNPDSAYSLASAFAKLRGFSFEPLINALGIGPKPSDTTAPPSPTQQPDAPWWLPGSPDFTGRLPFQPGYTGLPGQPSDDDGLITLHAGSGFKPPDMTQDADGLLVANPMAKAFKARREAVDEGQRQAQSDETDALIDELGKAKARKDAA
jgi:hypothetical protein